MKKSNVHFGEFISDEQDIMAAHDRLCRGIAAICQKQRGVISYYIGKTSGVEPIGPIKGRYDNVKKQYKFNEVWALYESKCAFTVSVLEDLLGFYFKKKNQIAA